MHLEDRKLHTKLADFGLAKNYEDAGFSEMTADSVRRKHPSKRLRQSTGFDLKVPASHFVLSGHVSARTGALRSEASQQLNSASRNLTRPPAHFRATRMAVPLEQFVKHLEDSGILAGDTLKDFIPPKASPKDAEELARELVRQKKLTKFQAEEVWQGKGKSLVLGNYVLLEKIGARGHGAGVQGRAPPVWTGSWRSRCCRRR